jgi:hypothetical protein
MVLKAPEAHAGKVIDVLPLLKSMPDVAPLIPHPSLWARSGLPILSEAIEFIEAIVPTDAFRNGPPANKDDWIFISGKLLVNGTLSYDGILEIAGRHFQHVAGVAAARHLLDSILSKDYVPDHVKARFRSCATYGSGAWHSITCVGLDTELNDDAYVHSILRRLGHPHGSTTAMTRCICSNYNWNALPAVGGILSSTHGGHPARRILTEIEHALSSHWEGICGDGGGRDARHNAFNLRVVRLFKALGFIATVKEVAIGAKPGKTPQKVDGSARNAARFAQTILFDGTIRAALQHSKLPQAAAKDDLVLEHAEKLKCSEKQALSEGLGCIFLPIAADSFSAFGPAFRKFIHEEYAIKLGLAGSDEWKWQVTNEKLNLTAIISAGIQRDTFNLYASAATATASQRFVPPAHVPYAERVEEPTA